MTARGRGGFAIWAVAFGLVLFTACARSSVPSPMEAVDEGERIDWSNPRPGVAVPATLGAARDHVPFTLIEPRLGPPTAIFITSNEEPAGERVVWFVFDEASGGPFWVVELLAHAEYPANFDEAIANCNQNPDHCPGTWSAITVREGLPALLIEGPQVTSLLWRNGDVEMRLMGPAETFTGQDAVDVAGRI